MSSVKFGDAERAFDLLSQVRQTAMITGRLGNSNSIEALEQVISFHSNVFVVGFLRVAMTRQ